MPGCCPTGANATHANRCCQWQITPPCFQALRVCCMLSCNNPRLARDCSCHTLLLRSAAAAGGLLLCTLLLGVVHNDAGALSSSQLHSSKQQQDDGGSSKDSKAARLSVSAKCQMCICLPVCMYWIARQAIYTSQNPEHFLGLHLILRASCPAAACVLCCVRTLEPLSSASMAFLLTMW